MKKFISLKCYTKYFSKLQFHYISYEIYLYQFQGVIKHIVNLNNLMNRYIQTLKADIYYTILLKNFALHVMIITLRLTIK